MSAPPRTTAGASASAAAPPAADNTNSPSSPGEGGADGDKPSPTGRDQDATGSPPAAAKEDSNGGDGEEGGDPMSVDGGHDEDTAVGSSSAQDKDGGGEEKAADKVEVSRARTASVEPEAGRKPATSPTETDASPAASDAPASKKRPREEEVEDGVGGETGDAAAAAVAIPGPAAAGPAESSENERSERNASRGEKGPVGGDASGASGAVQGDFAAGPEVFKPLEDPNVDEVVSQDLATQEIKRVRREANNLDTQPPPQSDSRGRQAAEADKGGEKVSTGGNSGRAAGADGVERANGAAPAEQPAAGNGPRAVDGGERKEQIEERGVGGERAAAGESKAGGGTSGGEGKEAPVSKAPAAAVAAAGGGGAEKSPGADNDEKTGPGTKQPNGVAAGEAAGAAAVSLSPSAKSDATPRPPSGAKPAPVPTEATGSRAAPSTSSPSSSPARDGVAPSSDGGRKSTHAEGVTEKPGGAAGQDGTAGPQLMEEEDEEGKGEKRHEAQKGKGKEGTEAVEAAAGGAKAAAAAKRRSSCPDHALPMARAFFDFETVSGLEMRMLPEFFTGRSATKTPEMYIQSRNYMVRSYQRMLENDAEGQAFLTGTECRRKLAGDACSILRIHDFLDRFGLINTRAAGKRPASLPLAPPSMHLWNPPTTQTPTPTPPHAAAPSSRREVGASATVGRHLSRGAGAAGAEGAWGQAAGGGRREQGGASGGGGGGGADDREWHRDELVLLMEAAVANPHQWDAVAHRVAGGRTPAACMKRFLTLAVEEVVPEDEKVSASAAPESPAKTGSAAAAGTSGDAGSTTAGAGSSSSMSAGGGKGVGATDEGRLRGLPKQQQQQQQQSQQQQRPSHLGQAVPALVLASALVSTVHPEVLAAAMAAATEAVDGVVRRSSATNKGGGDSGSSRPGSSNSSFASGKRGFAAEMEGGGRHPGDGEEADVEMLDVEDGASGTNGEGITSTTATISNGGQRRLAAVATPKLGRERLSGGGGGGSASVAGLELAGAARAAVLSVAGLQARALAEQEERRTEALLSDLLEARVQRLEAKLHCFDELDQVLETERQSLEHDRAELLLEQARSTLSNLELPSDGQVVAPTSQRARDIALPENKFVLSRHFPSLGSSDAARARSRVNGGKHASKAMLNDALQWLKQKDEAQGSQKAPDVEEKKEGQKESGSFIFFNPSQDQGIASSSNTPSRPAVEGKRPHRRRNSADSGLLSAPGAGGGDDRRAFAPAPIGGSSRQIPAADDNAPTAGDDHQEESDTAVHTRSTKSSWGSFMKRAGRGSAAPYRKDLEHDRATRSKPWTPVWSFFFLGQSDRGGGNYSPKAAATKQRRWSLPGLPKKCHKKKGGPEESRPAPVPGDSGGRGKVTSGGAGRSGSIPSTPTTSISVSTGSTLSTSTYATARRKSGASALPEASPKIPQAKPSLNSNPNPRLGVFSSAGVARLSKKEDFRESRDKGGVAPSPAGGGDGSARRRSSRTGDSKFDRMIEEASRSSIDLRGQKNHRGNNHNDSVSSNGGGSMTAEGARRVSLRLEDLEGHRRGRSRDRGSNKINSGNRSASVDTGRLSVKLEGLQNRRGKSRDRGSTKINRRNRAASVDTGGLSVKPEGLQKRRGRSAHNLGGSTGLDRVASTATTTRSRSSRSQSSAAAAKPGERSGIGRPEILAAGAGGGGNNGEVDALAVLQRPDDEHVVGSVGSAFASASRATPAPSKSAAKATVSRRPAATATCHEPRGSPSVPHVVVLVTAAAEETHQRAEEKEPADYGCGGGAADYPRGSSTPSGACAATISAALLAAVAASRSDGSDIGGTDHSESAAPPENFDESPRPSSDGSRWPVYEQRQQHMAPATATAAVELWPARSPAAARSVFWRQTTGTLERVHNDLDLQAYNHAPGGNAPQEWRSTRGTSEEDKMGREESKATAAGRIARKPNRAKARRQQPPAPPVSVWVAQHIDKSERHGVAFLMSDGSVVMRFRDDTVMVLEPMSGAGDKEERGALEYYVKAGKDKASPPSPLRFIPEGGVSEAAATTSGGSGGGGDRGSGDVKKKRRQDEKQQQAHIRRMRYTMSNVPSRLEKKAKLLATFRRRLLALAEAKDPLRGGGGDGGGGRDRSRKGEASVASGANTPWEPSILVEAYRPTRHSCLFVLSDSSLQMAFSDGTKILMAGNSDLVTLIPGDGQQELETVSFARALKANRTDITERVVYSKRLIQLMQEQERKICGGNAARQSARE
eukprot:g11837.t1